MSKSSWMRRARTLLLRLAMLAGGVSGWDGAFFGACILDAASINIASGVGEGILVVATLDYPLCITAVAIDSLTMGAVVDTVMDACTTVVHVRTSVMERRLF